MDTGDLNVAERVSESDDNIHDPIDDTYSPFPTAISVSRSQRDTLPKLEFAWGMNAFTLNLDTTKNLIWLDCTMHKLFDHRYWALLPSPDILDRIQKFVLDQIEYEDREKITEAFPHQIYEYTFVQLKPSAEPYIHCEPPEFSAHFPPFLTLSPILSHIHPYFVICNAALKDQKFHPVLKRGKQSDYDTLAHDPSLLGRLRLYRAIYALWDKPMPLHFGQLVPPSRPGSNASSGHSTTSRRTTRSTKRRRELEDDATANADDNTSQGYKPTESAPTQSLSTPGESHDPLDYLSPNVGCSHVEASYLSKVGTWLQGLEQSAGFNNYNLTGRTLEP